MPEKPEAVPNREVVEAVRRQVVAHLINELEAELGHPLVATEELYKDGVVLDRFESPEKRLKASPQPGRVRLRFRPTFHEDRFLFMIDAVFEPDERQPSFSGFTARGQVSGCGSDAKAEFSTWSVKRNDRDWLRWL